MSKVVLLADTRVWMRSQLRSCFVDIPCVAEVHEATASNEVEQWLSFQQIDLLVIQQTLITHLGRFPPRKLVVLASELDENMLLEAYSHQALGYLLESAPLECFLMSLHLSAGQFILDPTLTALRLKAFMRDQGKLNEECLTLREREVLALRKKGWSNGAIAQVLCISETTVKTHVKHIYRKLDLKRVSTHNSDNLVGEYKSLD